MTRAALWVGSVFLLCLGAGLQMVQAQVKPDGPDVYGARNTFGATAEYSNDSSHMVLGSFNNLKLGAVGLQYQRRLVASRYAVLSYALEFRPVILESVEKQSYVITQTSPVQTTTAGSAGLTSHCVAGSFPFSFTVPTSPPVTYAGTTVETCSRQLNYAQGFSPVGFRVNLHPHGRLQPTLSGFGGYILSTQPLPISNAGSFNFSFEFGVGLEYYLAKHRSVRFEYQVQHYSNDYTANANPGVDSGIFKLTYAFGR